MNGMRSGRSLRHRASVIDDILRRTYGEKRIRVRDDPVDTLVETILSQNTTDVNSHRSFLALKKEYPDWRMLVGESVHRVSKVIRSGGLPDVKAKRIIDALGFINNERGKIELDFLREMEPDVADQWLAQMKGVGPKTRSIVLLFSLGMPAFPVDTHVHRVTKRLGLIGQRVSREAAQDVLGTMVPSERYYSFHINLIEHGRAVCKARNPSCNGCVLFRHCDNPPEAQP